MAVGLRILITKNSQNVAENTSNVTVLLTANWTYGSFSRTKQNGWLKIDGTTYNFTASFNENETTSGTQTLFSKTVDVKHNSEGLKTLSCSASYTTGGNSGTVTTSASSTLSTIPRKSTLTIGNGTLGTAMTMTVNKKDKGFKHKIYYTLSGTKTYIAGSSNGYSTETSISWTPPLSIASTVTTATSRSFSVCLETYNVSNAKIGENWYSFTLSLPASIKPSVSISVKDATGYADTYGGMLAGLSKMEVKLTATPSYGSPIVKYASGVGGVNYNTSSYTTGYCKVGEQRVTATVTDQRGRTGTASVMQEVLPYHDPAITKLAVHRCDANGVEDLQGEHAKVTFSASASALNKKNNASYVLKWKKTTESSFVDDNSEAGAFENLTNFSSTYIIENQSFIFPAESSFSYDIELTVEDDFKTVTKGTVVSTGYAVLHFNESGKGLAVGKISESDVFDVGMETMLTGGLSRIELPVGTDLDTVRKANFYACLGAGEYEHAPTSFKSGHTFTLEVLYGGQGAQIIQRAVACDNKYYYVAVRSYYASAGWGDWSTRIRGSVTSGKWIHGRDNAMLGSTNAPTSGNYNPTTTAKTSSGSWQTGVYEEDFYVSYTKDSDYSSGTNTAVHGLSLTSDGYVKAKRTQISNPDSDTYYNAQSGDYSISFGIGAGQVNRGIYDHTRGHWMLHNDASNTFLSSTGNITFRANSSSSNPQVTLSNSSQPGFYPTVSGKGYIGLSNNKWAAVYATNGTIQTSDRNQKENILDIDERYEELFKRLRPVTYELKGADHDRVHVGFIAQEIEEAMEEVGLTAEDFAGFCVDNVTDEETGETVKLYSLRYSEFVALNARMIQKQQNKIDELESRLKTLETLLNVK